MYGFEAIAAYNGWAMALAGALIVMAGLTVLSFVISQLHRIVALFEYRKPDRGQPPKGVDAGRAKNRLALSKGPPSTAEDLMAAAPVYKQLADNLGPSFQLRELYAISIEQNLPHPHLTIKSLREAGLLVARGDGVFSWKPETMAS